MNYRMLFISAGQMTCIARRCNCFFSKTEMLESYKEKLHFDQNQNLRLLDEIQKYSGHRCNRDLKLIEGQKSYITS